LKIASKHKKLSLSKQEFENDMYRLANIIYPTQDLCQEESLYFRPSSLSWYSYEEKILYLKQGGQVKFNTYFNSFSIGKWTDNTSIEKYHLFVKAKGYLQFQLIHIDANHKTKTIKVVEFKSSSGTTTIEVPRGLTNGIIYFTCKALDDSIIELAYWGTTQKPKNEVKLALAITTFNRHDAVKAAVTRILRFLHQTTEINAHLVVTDNGQNVTLAEDKKLTYIPNKNLGGSGGFARSLFYLIEESGDFTHCIFMDDDAAGESESIYRTYQLLQYSKNETLAIAGAMLFSNEQFIQWESGASFTQRCKARKCWFNLKNINSLVTNEDDEPFDYGGWWFFAFPIKLAEYPYPFFVKGDDVNFGLQDQFKQITMNGISSWADDFFNKESPLTLYLAVRSDLVHYLQVKRLGLDSLALLKAFWVFIIRYTFMMKYATAEAQIEAIKDVMKGPQFFEKNIDMQNVFSKLIALNQMEKSKPLELKNRNDFDFFFPPKNYPPIKRVLRIASLNGHLIPFVFFKKKGMLVNKSEFHSAGYFRRKIVCLYDKDAKEGYFLHHSKRKFFYIWLQAILASITILKCHKKLVRQYQDHYSYLTSKHYWEKQFFSSGTIAQDKDNN
jgi:GT2 family glycosyltransferase